MNRQIRDWLFWLALIGVGVAAVAGVAALIQSADKDLTQWPEGCRAILLAGAQRNVKDQTWWQDVAVGTDAADGSGALDALESYRISLHQRSRNRSGVQRGWGIGTLQSHEFDVDRWSKFVYRIKVPLNQNGIPAPTKVKVALAWNSEVMGVLGFPIGSQLTVDLDLAVHDSIGNQAGYSGSYDNSYEIAEFEGEPGETYEIKIRRWSGTYSTWFGIAWTVTYG